MMCEHQDYLKVVPGTRWNRTAGPAIASLAEMWREVYDHNEPCSHSSVDGSWCSCVDGRATPEDAIAIKECACCEGKEFTEQTDYICLWCRYYEREL